MASGPMPSWQANGKTWKHVTDFIFLVSTITIDSDRLYGLFSKITAGGDCSHEIKRHLLLGRKAMTNIALTKKHMTNMLFKSKTAY